MKLSRITTPVGVAKFPWLNEPDTKFESQRNKGGEYHVDLRLPEAESAALVQRLETILQEWMALKNAEQEELKKKPYKPFNTLPWSEDFDDAGNPTGEYVFKFKRGVQWEDRDGNVRTNVLKFVDSHGQGGEFPHRHHRKREQVAHLLSGKGLGESPGSRYCP